MGSKLPRRDEPPLPSAGYELRLAPASHETMSPRQHDPEHQQRSCGLQPRDTAVYDRPALPDHYSREVTVSGGHSQVRASAAHNALTGVDVDTHRLTQLHQSKTTHGHLQHAESPDVCGRGGAYTQQRPRVNDGLATGPHPGAIENHREALAIWEKVKKFVEF